MDDNHCTLFKGTPVGSGDSKEAGTVASGNLLPRKGRVRRKDGRTGRVDPSTTRSTIITTVVVHR